jgi:hypothetical protein
LQRGINGGTSRPTVPDNRGVSGVAVRQLPRSPDIPPLSRIRNISADMEAVADLRRPHTGSQQVDTINSNAAILVIEFDFTESGMRIPVH